MIAYLQNRLRAGWTRALATALAFTFLGSCSTEREPGSLFGPSEAGLLVVDALLIVGQALPEIRLTRAGPADRDYFAGLNGVGGAQITIRETGGASYPYIETQPGLYRPTPPTDVTSNVDPQQEYTLEVLTAEGERLTARTLTPPPFSVTAWVLIADDGTTPLRTLRTFSELGDSVYYAPENQLVYPAGILEAQFGRPSVQGFQLGLRGLDRDSGLVVPADFLSEEDRADLPRSVSSPVFESADGLARLPWFAVYYAGRHVYRLLALDDNTFDYVRSAPDQGGSAIAFGGNAGDEFQRPIFHVQGGIGLFGSASMDSVGFNVVRP